ncbi:hypothetical protein DFH06DRAFT_1138565 [Mycena polygramma]|nr:hypothetical protein DFH06DRAFT_1138565 [Mycena polygramma]
MDDAPPHLLLSALTWKGSPTTWFAGNDDELIGTYYTESANVQLNKVGTNTEMQAVEYSPATPTSFQYTRRAEMGLSGSTVTYEGATFGENMPPLVRVCLPDRLPWPEKFKHSDEMGRPRAGPPFEFYNIDWNGHTGIHPEYLGGLTFSPDVPGQLADDMLPEADLGHEPDSTVGLGWHGNWVTTLLEKQDRGEPLGERNEIVWNKGEHATWGMEVCLQALKATEMDPDLYEDVEAPEDRSRGISDYEVRATVLRVFVKPNEFLQMHEPDEDSESEDEDDEDIEDE